jgi:DNA (cytosine-5)-methyltransferase 1
LSSKVRAPLPQPHESGRTEIKSMRYISLFSGIGGLEASDLEPELVCESSEQCREVLSRKYTSAEICDDVISLNPPKTDVVAGGWPCQDLSVAGKQVGLQGERSGLFFHMMRVAQEARAETIVAENVPNLVTMNKGRVFEEVIATIRERGFEHVAWRLLNSRQFGLPHQRRRIFIVASKHPEIAKALHRPISTRRLKPRKKGDGSAFYWTAGIHGICYSEGFVPTLKVGSSLSIPSPPAIHFDGVVRKATARECLKLQGFKLSPFKGIADKFVHSMAGNAVSVPVGKFVFDSCKDKSEEVNIKTSLLMGFGRLPYDGMVINDQYSQVHHPEPKLATNLRDFIDLKDNSFLSQRAANGLLNRLTRSGKPCPEALREIIQMLAATNPESV